MFSMRKFFALVFMVLMCTSSAWAASDWYVVASSNGEKIKYVSVTSGNGTIDTAQWTAAESGTETTLPQLIYTTITTGGDTVYLKAGTYYTTTEIDIRKDITIYGGFSGSETTIDTRDLSKNITTINGSKINKGSDTTGTIFYINKSSVNSENNGFPKGEDTTATVMIDGLFLTGANSTSFFGAAMYIDGGTVTASNCIFKENTSYSGGGAIFVWKGKTNITNCVIANNSAPYNGGGILIGNSQEGSNAEVIVTNCTITGNKTTDNTKRGGGGVFLWHGKATLTNCTITGNTSAARGGGVLNWLNDTSDTNELTIINCTIAGNTAATDKGNEICFSTRSKTEITNSLIWNAATTNMIADTATTDDTNTTTTHTLTITNCALPSGVTLGETITKSGTNVDVTATELTKDETHIIKGVTHTVYRIEDNTALASLAGAGVKNDSTPTTDQLGNTRNDPPSIGAVEKVETPVVSPTTLTITGTEDTAITAQTITVTKGEDVTWSTSGTLPDGLKAESADKTFTISGTPAVGSAKTDAYTYTVTAKNSAGSTPVTVTITIKAVAPVLDQTGEISKTFTEGVKIEDITIKATAGSNLTWTADSSKLPKGLTGAEAADKASFTISGTPDTGSAGSYTYTVTAASATGDKAEVTYKITVNAAAASVKPVLDTTEKSINAVEGTAIETLTINATAGDNLTWSASGTLPNGLKASSADKTFTISGTPAVGTAQDKAYSYTVKTANSAGEASAVITITVSALTAPALDVTTASITANEGQEIDSLTITATAGNNLTWTTSGDLPDGLTGTAASDKMSFTISGTPSDSTARMDAYTYSVTAMNTAGSASAVITITVNSTGGINDEVSNALEELAATGESMTLEDALTKSLGLSEEQLKTVTSITIPSNITDLGDLASLLPNLEAIDLTSATSLTEVDLRGNTSIKEVTIAGNSSVTTLDLRNSAVETLDATGCDELTEVNIAGNTNIQTLSLDECPNIEEFNAEGCENLTDLSLSNKGSEGRRGKLSSLELRGCRNLKNLGFKGNMMKRFHVRDFSLNSLETLSAGDQAVGNVTLSRRFSFIDFFRNLLFNSNVSISESESESDSELTELELKISAESGDSNVKSVTAYDEGDNKISSSYDPETGEAVFSSTPARIEYDYDTGFDSEESMDVAISGEGLEDNGDMTLNNSSSGGCNSSFASGALLAFLGFILAKSKSHKH